jgi:co-chaperonin GroES (HSP10)
MPRAISEDMLKKPAPGTLAEKYTPLTHSNTVAFILVRRIDAEDEFSAGEHGVKVVKPEIARSKSVRAKVESVAAHDHELAVGDFVIITKHGGTDLVVDGQNLLIVERKQIYLRENQ